LAADEEDRHAHHFQISRERHAVISVGKVLMDRHETYRGNRGAMDMLSNDGLIGDLRENTLGAAQPTRLETPLARTGGLGIAPTRYR